METVLKKVKSSNGTYSSIEEAVESKIKVVQKILDKMPSNTKKKIFGDKIES